MGSSFGEYEKYANACSHHIARHIPRFTFGNGRTTMLQLLSEYLTEKNDLMDFYGDVKYLEFMLNYCPSGEHFSELQRLMNEIDNAAGFRYEYRGIVYIDIDEWIGHFEEKHFVSFMEYLSDNSDSWLVVLSVSKYAECSLRSRKEKLGDIAKAEGDLTEAKRYYTLGLEISEALAKETGTVGAYDDLALSYYKIALTQISEESVSYLLKALSIWEQLSQACPNVLIFARRRDGIKDLLGIK